LRRDERRRGGRDPGRDQDQAARAPGQEAERGGKTEALRVRPLDLRAPDGPAIRRGAPLGGRHHRPGADARGARVGARGRVAESGGEGVQDGSAANVVHSRKSKSRKSKSPRAAIMQPLFNSSTVDFSTLQEVQEPATMQRFTKLALWHR